jgi:hypothetical protein
MGSYIVKTTGQKASGNFCVSGTRATTTDLRTRAALVPGPTRQVTITSTSGLAIIALAVQYPCQITLIAIAIYSGTLTGTQVAKVASAMADI